VTLRALIVEDEPLARERLRLMLAEHPDVEVVGECADAPDGIRAAQEFRPDVLLLDVQLPGADGFAVLEALRTLEPSPFVIFITAHADHAVRAFDENAVDYLLKPYNAARTSDALITEVRALTSALRSPERGTAATSGAGAAQGAKAPPAAAQDYPKRFSVTLGRRIVFVPVDEVEWVEAERNYVCLHTAKRQYLFRATLTDMERQLDPVRFVRVHRSAIVRRDRVREIEPLPNGSARATLASGAVVPVAAAYRDRLY
jgi:two-component system, LytTR family, response regulator